MNFVYFFKKLVKNKIAKEIIKNKKKEKIKLRKIISKLDRLSSFKAEEGCILFIIGIIIKIYFIIIKRKITKKQIKNKNKILIKSE